MSLVWCSISGHGFGHGAQVIPVLNEVGRRIPSLRMILRTTIPASFFGESLLPTWEYSESQQDIGCVQNGPLSIDIPKTWKAYEQLHQNWEIRVSKEADAIRASRPDLVLSNISHLGIAAGVRAGCPTVALGSLSWDKVLAEYLIHGRSKQEAILEQIRQAYRGAQMLIRLFPGIQMEAFSMVRDVGPILFPAVLSQGTIRRILKIADQERLVLVAFGGIPVSSLPLEKLEGLKGYRFLISGSQDCRAYTRIESTDCVGLPFRQIFAEADIIVTKPGYATVVEAVRSQLPIVYVRRYNFADEQPLVDFAHRFGQATELSLEEFQTGRWGKALHDVQGLPASNESMPYDGTEAAADHLISFL